MSTSPQQLMDAYRDDVLRRGIDVIRTEAEALGKLGDSLDRAFVLACEAILAGRGRVVVTGMGKSGHVGRKIAATLAATGTPAIYIHPAEAAHGDLGMLVSDDLLLVLSNSGNTAELRAILDYALQIGVKIVGIASRRESLVIERADVGIVLPPHREACPVNIAPTTSTTMQLALGDALAMALMDMRGFSRDSMKQLHPGGAIGLRLTAVGEIMHVGEKLPLVPLEMPMKEVIVIISARGFGIAGVVDSAGRLVGVITDGDLRRHFEDLTTATASDVMTPSPKTLSVDILAEDALDFLNRTKITCAFVIEPDAPVNPQAPVGIVHIHDFLRIGLG
jgi:arabinose-5-phosphate isomerase